MNAEATALEFIVCAENTRPGIKETSNPPPSEVIHRQNDVSKSVLLFSAKNIDRVALVGRKELDRWTERNLVPTHIQEPKYVVHLWNIALISYKATVTIHSLRTSDMCSMSLHP